MLFDRGETLFDHFRSIFKALKPAEPDYVGNQERRRTCLLFIISEDVETGIEKTLTEIILLLFKELFAVYAGKARWGGGYINGFY